MSKSIIWAMFVNVVWVIFLLVLPISVNAQVSNDKVHLTYSDPVGGFQIQYPSGWKAIPVETIAISTVEITAPPETFVDLYDKNAVVKITAIKLPSERKTLEQLTDYKLIYLTNFMPGYAIVDSNTSNIAGLPAYKVVYKSSVGEIGMGMNQKVLEVWTIHGDKWYDIIYIAPVEKYDKYLPVVNEMTNTLQIS